MTPMMKLLRAQIAHVNEIMQRMNIDDFVNDDKHDLIDASLFIVNAIRECIHDDCDDDDVQTFVDNNRENVKCMRDALCVDVRALFSQLY